MSENPAFRLLEKPWLYRLTQSLLAPGADELVVQYIQELLAHLPPPIAWWISAAVHLPGSGESMSTHSE